jgi:preprotein translocase subunit SecG
MQTLIIVIHLMLVLGLIGVVLLQRSEGGGLGAGSSGGFLTSRGTANILTRATALLAAGFFVTSLILSIIAGLERKPRSILQNSATPSQQPAIPGSVPAPLGQGGGVLDSLGQRPAQPPATPSGPQIPPSR